jgi:hypothetical protein
MSGKGTESLRAAWAAYMSVDFLDLRTPETLRPHAVEVSYATLRRLRQVVVPESDSLDNVIAHLLDNYEARRPDVENAALSAKDVSAGSMIRSTRPI